jgi:hypothetical protein
MVRVTYQVNGAATETQRGKVTISKIDVVSEEEAPSPAVEELDLTVEVNPELADVIPVSQETMDAIDVLLGQDPIKATDMQTFVNSFVHRYGHATNVRITYKGSHRVLHYNDRNGHTATVGMWAAHTHGNSIHQSAGGVGDALRALQRLCFVPEAAERPPADEPPPPPARSARPARKSGSAVRKPPARLADTPPPPPLIPLIVNRDPELPRLLYELDEGRYIGPTGFDVNIRNFGQFQIYHVPNDGNCLFAAIGYFVGIGDQREVRLRIHNYVQGILGGTIPNPNQAFLTPGRLDAIIYTTTPARFDKNRFGNDNDARMAAIVFQRRVFIVNHFHGGDIPAYEGYDADGTRIDMAHPFPPINPNDIVLYFILNPGLDPGPGGRHIEALIRQ